MTDDRLRTVIEEVFEVVEAVHTRWLPRAAIPIVETSWRQQPAFYIHRDDGTALAITISRDADNVALTFLHELGHFIDHQGVGTVGTFASSSGELSAWQAAAEGSDAVGELRRLEAEAPIAFPSSRGLVVTFDAEDFRYRLQLEELFARSYAQWIASRSETGRLRAELRAAQGILYPEQWTDPDFEPIATTLDGLLGS